MLISFVGHSGSGKTTLIEKLTALFSEKGILVGTIKHTDHDFEADREASDSYRHFNAGAIASMIISQEKLAFFKRGEKDSLPYLAQKYFSDCEIILAEGFKKEDVIKIEVYRKELGKEPFFKSLKNVIAVATDKKLDGIKNIDINDIKAIYDFIVSLKG